MASSAPTTELYLPTRPATATQVEQCCRAATHGAHGAVGAIAVDVVHVAQAAELLFGTSVNVVSRLEPGLGVDHAECAARARHSVAGGANDVELRSSGLGTDALRAVRWALGSAVPIGIDLRELPSDRVIDLAGSVQQAGADYVTLAPVSAGSTGSLELAEIVGVLARFGLGVKVRTSGADSDATTTRLTEELLRLPNTRISIPVTAVLSDRP